MVPPKLLLTGQRAVIGGEALNATFGPSNCPPTNSATSNAAASKLPPITAKKPMLDLWCAISRSRTTTPQGVHRSPRGEGMASRSCLPSYAGDIRSGGLADLLSEHAAHLIVLWNRNDSPAPAWSIGVEMAWEKRRAKQATRVPI